MYKPAPRHPGVGTGKCRDCEKESRASSFDMRLCDHHIPHKKDLMPVDLASYSPRLADSGGKPWKLLKCLAKCQFIPYIGKVPLSISRLLKTQVDSSQLIHNARSSFLVPIRPLQVQLPSPFLSRSWAACSLSMLDLVVSCSAVNRPINRPSACNF